MSLLGLDRSLCCVLACALAACDGAPMGPDDAGERTPDAGERRDAGGEEEDAGGGCVECCGNGDIDPGEDCDDGNAAPGDGCEPRGSSRECRFTCTNAAECGDADACNGTETCLPSHLCMEGSALPDGTVCSSASVADGVCQAGACSPAPSGEECTPSSEGSVADDEDGDGAIDEGCEWRFGPPHAIGMIRTSAAVAPGAPFLSTDGLRLYFRTGNASGQAVLAMAERASTSARFGRAAIVAGPDSGTLRLNSGLGLSADELELYVRSPTNADIEVSTRATRLAAFGARALVANINDPVATDQHPFLSADGLELFFASTRAADGISRIHRSTRAGVGDDWSTPVQITLGAVPSTMGEQTPMLSSDGHTLFFATVSSTGRALYMARRASSDTAVFDAPTELVELGTTEGESHSPFVSQATREIFFQSNRPWSPWTSGSGSLWRAEICRDGACEDRTIECPVGGRRSNDGLHCYVLDSTARTWSPAEAACVEAGGHLASVHSAAEHELLNTMIGTARAWFGLNDRLVEGTYEWSSGETALYLSWAAGNPDDCPTCGGEECGELYPNTTAPLLNFNDRACSTSQQSICETDLWPVF